jgi:hypothetical protein
MGWWILFGVLLISAVYELFIAVSYSEFGGFIFSAILAIITFIVARAKTSGSTTYYGSSSSNKDGKYELSPGEKDAARREVIYGRSHDPWG